MILGKRGGREYSKGKTNRQDSDDYTQCTSGNRSIGTHTLTHNVIKFRSSLIAFSPSATSLNFARNAPNINNAVCEFDVGRYLYYKLLLMLILSTAECRYCVWCTRTYGYNNI